MHTAGHLQLGVAVGGTGEHHAKSDGRLVDVHLDNAEQCERNEHRDLAAQIARYSDKKYNKKNKYKIK